MGCCSSSPIDRDSARGKPFKREGLTWTASQPLTHAQLAQQRSTFWETQPNYGGRPEIWQALQAAVESTQLAVAQSILDAANIHLPTGNPANGCYDELGNRYEIPLYCLVPPTNMINDTSTLSTPMAVQAQSVAEPPAMSDTGAPDYPILIRLSTAQDLKMMIHARHEPVEELIERIFAHPDIRLSHDTHNLRLIYLGQKLDNHITIIGDEDAPSSDDTPLPARVVKVGKGGVIQAFVIPKQSN